MTERPTPRPLSWRATSDNWALCKSADSQAVGWAVLRYRLLDWAPIVERPAECRACTDAREASEVRRSGGAPDTTDRGRSRWFSGVGPAPAGGRRVRRGRGRGRRSDRTFRQWRRCCPTLSWSTLRCRTATGSNCVQPSSPGSRAAVVLTSSRPIVGLQDRLRLSGARGFIPKSELSGIGHPRADRLTGRWPTAVVVLAVAGSAVVVEVVGVPGSGLTERRGRDHRRGPADLRVSGLADAGSPSGRCADAARRRYWFLGTLVPVALLWHRGPLAQLTLTYPTGRIRRAIAVAAIVIAYLTSVVEPLARNGWVTIAMAALICRGRRCLLPETSGPARKAGRIALGASLALAGVLILARSADWPVGARTWRCCCCMTPSSAQLR